MRLRRSLALCTLFVLFAAPAYAARVFVEDAIGSGVSGGDLQTATDLVKSAVSQVSSDELVSEFSKADYTLEPKLMRLGQSYILAITKVRNGKMVFSTQQKAYHMDELDRVALETTRSAIEERRVAERSEPRETAPYEMRHRERESPRRPDKAAYFGIGINSLQDLGTTGLGLSLGLGYGWDVHQGVIRVLADGEFNGSALFMSGTLGGIYSLLPSDTSPYIGADFGVGFAKVDAGSLFAGQLVFGFAGALDAGVQLFRNSTVNLDLGLRAIFLFNNTSFGMPQSYSLRLGIYY